MLVSKKIGVVEKYQEFLTPVKASSIISLNEGTTPMILAERLPGELGLGKIRIYFKFEGLNPTGSFKDRGMTMAMSKAVESGSKAVICASTGNTSASAAAYASRCGLKCIVLIPDGKIAKGKLVQAYRYGATVIRLRGNFDKALALVKEAAEKHPITVVNSINPYRIEGQKTAAFEIIDDLGEAPDYHAIPVGNAGNITAYWAGYKQYKQAGRSSILPKMLGFQAAGAAPIVQNKVVSKPETIATAIRIGDPASWKGATSARDESGGLIDSVTDKEIEWAYRFIAEREGVFAEPASAAAVAGVKKLSKTKYFKPDTTIVITLTGSGLKDPDYAQSIRDETKVVEPVLSAIDTVLAEVLK